MSRISISIPLSVKPGICASRHLASVPTLGGTPTLTLRSMVSGGGEARLLDMTNARGPTGGHPREEIGHVASAKSLRHASPLREEDLS